MKIVSYFVVFCASPKDIFDVVLENSQAYLLDFSPLLGSALLTLFTWVEIEALFQGSHERFPIVRVLESSVGIQVDDSVRWRVPYDLVDVSSDSALSTFIQDQAKDGEEK